MALSNEQILLLNNLMYVYSFDKSMSSYENKTVGEFINSIDTSSFTADKNVTDFTSGTEWKNLLNAIENDPTLTNMTIASTHVDNGPNNGGGFSAVFIDETSNEAVVAFKGTEKNAEWTDNFQGVSSTNMPDGVSTQHQTNALDWYKEEYTNLGLDDYNVTVTGHSKGGNKAKYITVMDPTVDRCVSFDGQGFSDEFCDKYQNEIFERSSKIQNHNVDKDPVNMLINDIGQTQYYKGNVDTNDIFENHCPNAFFKFDENGNYTITPSEQDPSMKELDNYLNSLIRSIPPEERTETAMFVNELRAFLLDKNTKLPDDISQFITLLTADGNDKYTSYILAFTAEYAQNHPDLENALFDIVNGLGGDSENSIVPVLVDIVKWEHFDTLTEVIGTVAGKLPDWAVDMLIDYIEKKSGIRLTREEALALLNVIEKIPNAQKEITSIPDGSDKADGTESGFPDNQILSGLKACNFNVRIDNLRNIAAQMENIANTLYNYAQETANCRMNHTVVKLYNSKIKRYSQSIEKNADSINQLKNVLIDVCDAYSKTETKVMSKI